MTGAVVEEVFVHLVGEDEEVVREGELREQLQLGAGEDLTAGVRGGVQDEAAGAGSDCRAETVEIESPIRGAERDDDGTDAEGVQRGDVVAVEGLKHDALVAWIEQRHQGGVECTGRA